MDPLVLFGIGFSTGLSGAMIPGPLFLYTVSEAFRKGQWVGVKIALGHLLLEAVFVALVVLGLREFLVAPTFRAAVVAVGGIGLIVMGSVILIKVRRLSLVRHADVPFRWGPWVGGAFFSIASPGFLIWWATIGASVFLQGALAGITGLTMVWAGHAMADVVWCWFVAWSVEQGRAYCSDRTYRLIMGFIALCLIGLGLWLPLEHLMAA